MPPGADWRFCPLCGGGLATRTLDEAPRRWCPDCGFVYWEQPRPAAAALVAAAGRILCVRRRHPPEAGGWCLPGGFLEPSETVEAAACREVREETGLLVEAVAQIGCFGVVIAFVAARPVGGRLQPGSDALAAEWFPARALPALCFPTHRAAVSAWLERGGAAL